MTRFHVAVHIVPRKGLLDPQGKAVADALHSLGFAGVMDVRVGRNLVVRLDEETDVADLGVQRKDRLMARRQLLRRQIAVGQRLLAKVQERAGQR